MPLPSTAPRPLVSLLWGEVGSSTHLSCSHWEEQTHKSRYPDDGASSGQQDGREPQVTRALTEAQTLLLPELAYISNKTHHSTLWVSQKKSVPTAGD